MIQDDHDYKSSFPDSAKKPNFAQCETEKNFQNNNIPENPKTSTDRSLRSAATMNED
jgi:hypothetical protein